MKKVTRFEDLRCWQAARGLVKEVFEAAEQGKLANDFDTKRQIKKAALSTMNNIAEGFGRFGRRDSIRFYDFSQSSALEILSMCYVLEDMHYLDEKKISQIRSRAMETKNLTLAFIRSNRSDYRGSNREHEI